MPRIMLHDAAATRRAGRLLARAVTECGPTALLLHGALGSGKTALTCALAESLPGGDKAEAASPTFTLCNMYPTTPPMLHCDLYRCPGSPPEELLDGLDDARALTVVEWAEYLPAADLPQDYLDIELQACEEHRLLTLRACGPVASGILRMLLDAWPAQEA